MAGLVSRGSAPQSPQEPACALHHNHHPEQTPSQVSLPPGTRKRALQPPSAPGPHISSPGHPGQPPISPPCQRYLPSFAPAQRLGSLFTLQGNSIPREQPRAFRHPQGPLAFLPRETPQSRTATPRGPASDPALPAVPGALTVRTLLSEATLLPGRCRHS